MINDTTNLKIYFVKRFLINSSFLGSIKKYPDIITKTGTDHLDKASITKH